MLKPGGSLFLYNLPKWNTLGVDRELPAPHGPVDGFDRVAGSIVLTTNRAFRDWGTTFDVDNTLATVLIDRLMHHGEALVIKGDNYRMKDKNPDSPSE
ncbi:MAG TPA: ATP-binding protein [Pirellulales bacterium]|nr:ATP-binding protein [Pirellulales bacterium]